MYKLNVSWADYAKLIAYATVVDTEIGGLGRVTIDKEKNEFNMGEIFLLEQTASPGDCELSAKGLAKFYDKLIEEDAELNDIKLWWHSHGDMGVFFSGTDTTTMSEWPADWLVAVVVNKKGEIKAKFQCQVPIPMVLDLEIVRETMPPYEFLDEIKKEVSEKVEETIVVCKSVVTTKGSNWNNYTGGYGYGNWKKEDEKKNNDKSIHNMTDAEYDAMISREYGLEDFGIDVEWEEWQAKYQAAKTDEDRYDLLLEAVEDDILTEEEVALYLDKSMLT